MVRRFRVRVGGRWFTVEVEGDARSPLKVLVDGQPVEVEEVQREGPAGAPRPVERVAPRSRVAPHHPLGQAERRIVSPMPGRVVAVTVRPGQQVAAGQEVCVVEAMKMEQSIRTSVAGRVKALHVRPSQNIAGGDLLVELE
ncbi:MAG: hypothetical protein HY686_03190 [Chloroflexi bacterium]|nr:hypothetical protein [Chloroflexota bacterium]